MPPDNLDESRQVQLFTLALAAVQGVALIAAAARARAFEGESVEVDAIPPAQLRLLVRHCIERHVDPAPLKTLATAEKSERDILLRLAAGGRGA